MALPTKELTWQYLNNQFVAAQGTILATNRRFVRNIFGTGGGDGTIYTFGSNPPTVRYSCDSVVAGAAGDGVNRWDADTDLVWAAAASAHSWIVLRYSQIGATFDLLISCESTNSNLVVATSLVGFSGGTTTARPTAADEQIHATTSTGLLLNSELAVGYRFHMQQSSDGKSFRLVMYSSSALKSVFMLGVPKNPVSGWTTPAWGYAGAGTQCLDYTVLVTPGVAGIQSRAPGVNMLMFMTAEFFGNSALPLQAVFTAGNQLDGAALPLSPLGLASTTVSAIGRHGVIYDLWLGLTTSGNGDTYPDDATRLFVTHGDMVFPNNGDIILLV